MTSPNDIQYLLDLPVETLSSLAAGYIAYRVAYTGKDRSHQPIDTVFITFVFAVIARLAANFIGASSVQLVLGEATATVALFVGFLVSFTSACIWRRWGEDQTFKTLRSMKISNSDRYDSAWETIAARGTSRPSQLTVRKKDGSTVMCENLSAFKDAPFGPCLFGTDGSIALYVTDFRAGGSDWETIDPNAPDWGASITYIPASEISEIELRHQR